MSWKSFLEEEKKRDKKRTMEVEVGDKPTDMILPVASNTNMTKDEYFKMKNKNNTLPIAKGGYIAKNFGSGIVNGIAGIAQGTLLNTANQMDKGAKSKNNAIELGLNVIKNLTNPMQSVNGIIKNIPQQLNDAKNIIQDKNKNALQKAVNLGLNASSMATNTLPHKQIINSANQFVGKVNPNASNAVMGLNNVISNPLEKMNQGIAGEGQNYDLVTNYIGKGSQAIGNMMPSMLATAVTKNPDVGMGVMMLGAKGQSTQEALNKGADLDTANKIGDTKALLEYGTEKMFGGLKFQGKGNLDDIVDNFVNDKVKGKLANFLIKRGLDIPEEQAEEVVSDLVGFAIDKGTIDPNATYTFDDLKETLITTALSTGGLNAISGGYSRNAYNQNALEMNNSQTINSNENLQQNQAQNENILQTQQVTNQENKIAQNGLSEQLPVSNKESSFSNKLKEQARQEIQNSKINAEEKRVMLEALDNVDTITEKDINDIRQTINNVTQESQTEQNKSRSFEDIAEEAMSNMGYNEVQSPLQNRNINTIGKETKVNAYQYENPEVKPYYQEMAKMIGVDLGNISSKDNSRTMKGGGTTLSTNTAAIEQLHNGMGYSYEQIKKGLDNIIEDNGKENNAVSKKLEIIIDDQLRNGYRNSYGKLVDPNQDYINLITGNNANEVFARASGVSQNNTAPTAQDALPVANEKYSVAEQSKDSSQINQEVLNYIKKNNLKMTADEFMEWASNKQLEQEDNMTPQQQELYSLIRDVQNRTMKEEIVDSDNGLWYNDKGIDFSNKFYEKQLDSSITTDTPRLEMNKIYTKEFGDNFYLFEKISDGKYNKYLQLKIEGNEELINSLEEAVKNGEFTNIQNINEIVDEYRNRDSNSNGIDSSIEEQTRENGQSGRFYREESESDIRPNSKTGNENSNGKIENSNRGSFSMQEDTSDNTTENEVQRKINRSMTMEQAKDMVQRAFVTGNIYEWFDGEYKNGDEWLAGEGADAVAMVIDNDYNLQNKYVNANNDIINDEYIIDDVIEAYQNGTLIGKSDNQVQRLDTSKSTNYEDTRFYAPKDIDANKDLYNIANQRVTNANRQEVYKARANFILNAHNEGYIESIGLTQKEVNEKLRSWTSYPKNAMETSKSINEGVASENRWTGIENCSVVNELSVTPEQLNSMVKEIKGVSNDYQRRYISNTMLAIDTHMDYKNLIFDFAPDASTMRDSVLGDYQPDYDIIRVKRDGQNTVSHEMGHYIDHLIGRELGDGYNLGLTRLCRSNLDNWTNGRTFTSEQKQFIRNFANFLDSIEDSADIGSSYKMSSDEVFARFVARFTEWTRNTATGNRYGYEAKWYDDKFTTSQFKEFAKLLQEYSLLKTTGQASGRSTTLASQRTGKVQDQRIEDIYSELYKNTNTAPTAGETQVAERPRKGKEVIDTKQETKKEQEQIAKILDEPITKQKEKSRAWAIAKANLIDKGIVFEELSHKTKNRELQGKWDYTLTAGARGQNAIGQARYEMDANNKMQKQISKSLEDIRSEVGKNTSEFQNYMYHQLNIDRMTLEERFAGDTGTNYERKDAIKNKPVFGENIDADYSRREVAKYEKAHPEFKEYAQDVYDFLDANKKELVDRGVISQELSDKLSEMYPHYVPIKRVDAKGAAIKVPLDTNRTGINSPLARATGGNSDIQPLFQTIADRTMQTYRASARNNFGLELMNTLNSVTESNQTDIETIIEEMGDENTELLKEGKNGQNPTFTVFNNGEKTTFEITKDMYDALKPQSEFIKNMNNSKLSKGLNAVSNFRRGVLTEYNPVFSLTNAMKDAQDVVINSQHPAKTFAKFPESYAQILQKGYWYNEYLQNGGEQNSYFKDGEFTSDKKQSKLKTAATLPLEAISKVNNVIEMAPRLAEYIASREAGRSVETSMLDAARVTTNFKAGGDITKTLNRNGVTFLNASVQGFQQQIRNIQEANVKGLKGYAALATKYAIAGLPALLLNGLIWKDDKDYEELQDYAKDNYYIIAKYGDGKFIRIPKGRVAATVQKIVSNATEYLTDDKKSLNIDNLAKDFWEDLKFAQDNIAPNNPLDNNVISPIIQAITNKTWYGSDLVPSRLQNKPKNEQYDESTDSLSIWLGDKLNVSPYKINYLLDQYGGGVSDLVLPRMTKQAENSMLEDKFTTDYVMKNKYPGDFYSELDELKIKANSIDAKDEDILKYKYNSSVSGKLGELYTKKREIQNSDLTDAQKKEKLKVVQKEINNLAKEALESTDKLKISGDTATIKDTQYYKTTSDGETKWNKITDKEKEKNTNISLKTYSDYKNKVAGKTKDAEKIDVLLNSSYSKKEKQAIYENYIKDANDKKYNIVKTTGIDINKYLEYKSKGLTTKDARYDYIVNMSGTTYMQKIILFGLENAPSEQDKKTIVNYINTLPGKTQSEKQEMLKSFSWYK